MINVLLGVLAIGVGVAVIMARERFVNAGEASRAAFLNKPLDSGHVRLRRRYSRTIVILVGSGMILVGVLHLVGVIE